MNPRTTLAGAALLGAAVLVPLGLAAARPEAPAAAAAPAAGAATQFAIDTTHSSVLFKVKHLGASWFYGRFNGISGEITHDEGAVDSSYVLFKIDVGSVDTKTGGLDDHLKSPDFFDAAQFPEIVFESESVAAGKEKGTLAVKGNLTLHGVTKPVEATVELVGRGKGRGGVNVAGFHTRLSLKRSEFGMEYGVAGGGVGDEVELIVSVEAAEKKG